jgi:hypothetical protein
MWLNRIATPQKISSNIKKYRTVFLKYWRVVNDKHFSRKTRMMHQTTFSLHTIPVQLAYRILDQVDDKTLFMSCPGVCQRLNAILGTYKPYLVTFHFFIVISFLSTPFWLVLLMIFLSIVDTGPTGLPVEALKSVGFWHIFYRF